jgi:hypothetical protein
VERIQMQDTELKQKENQLLKYQDLLNDKMQSLESKGLERIQMLEMELK